MATHSRPSSQPVGARRTPIPARARAAGTATRSCLSQTAAADRTRRSGPTTPAPPGSPRRRARQAGAAAARRTAAPRRPRRPVRRPVRSHPAAARSRSQSPETNLRKRGRHLSVAPGAQPSPGALRLSAGAAVDQGSAVPGDALGRLVTGHPHHAGPPLSGASGIRSISVVQRSAASSSSMSSAGNPTRTPWRTSAGVDHHGPRHQVHASGGCPRLGRTCGKGPVGTGVGVRQQPRRDVHGRHQPMGSGSPAVRPESTMA